MLPYTLHPISQMPNHVRQPLINLSQEDFPFPKMGNTFEHQTSNIFQSSGHKGTWKSVRAPSEGLLWMNKEDQNNWVISLNQMCLHWAFPFYFIWILWPKNLLSTWSNTTFFGKGNWTTELNWLRSSFKKYQNIQRNTKNIAFTEQLIAIQKAVPTVHNPISVKFSTRYLLNLFWLRRSIKIAAYGFRFVHSLELHKPNHIKGNPISVQEGHVQPLLNTDIFGHSHTDCINLIMSLLWH